MNVLSSQIVLSIFWKQSFNRKPCKISCINLRVCKVELYNFNNQLGYLVEWIRTCMSQCHLVLFSIEVNSEIDLQAYTNNKILSSDDKHGF